MAASVPERIGPYQVEGRLGEGGMGKVYKAYDEQLDRRVAIKLILSAEDGDADTRERFRREARAAARLSHSSIVQIFHLLEVDGDDYIVMEYVEGRTLAEVIRDGPVGLLLALSLAHDVAAGLAEAHSHGIVHRDLKTENVIVTPGQRAKILDFGLAKPIWAGESEAPLTGKGDILGTCRAMSPEQANGQEVDHRSDLFSFGTLLFETATGRSPFSAPTPVATLIQVCYHRQPSATNLNPAIPETFSELIDRLLAKDPNQRPQSAVNVTAILEQIADDSLHEAGRRGMRPSLVAAPRPAPAEESSSGARPSAVGEETDSSSSTFPWLRLTPTTAPQLPVRSWWRRRGVLAAGLAVLLVVVFVAGFFLSRLRRASPPIAGEGLMSLAVLGFKNLSGNPDTEWMSTAIGEVFSAELAASKQLYVIPGESVARMRLELALPEADALAADTLAKIRRNVGADLVMLGSYLALDQSTEAQLRLQVRVQETQEGKEVATASESGPQSQLPELVTRIGTTLRDRLGISQTASDEARATGAAISSSSEATRLYSEGLEKLRRYDASAAQDLLQRAVEIDPEYALAHAALSEAWMELHYDVKAEESALRALELASDLPREEVLMIEARRFEAARDWPQAADRYQVLWGFHPTNVEYGLRYAQAQTRAGEGTAALATVQQLRGLATPAGDDPRIDLAEAEVANSLSDLKRQYVAAERAAQKGEAQGAWILLAQARRTQGFALLHLGDRIGASAALEEARRLFERVNDRGNVAETISLVATVADFDGRLSEAKEIYGQALAILREIGYQERVAATLSNMALLDQQQGELNSAMGMHQEALEIARQEGLKRTEATALCNMALVLLELGELGEAEAKAQASLTLTERLGWRRGTAWNYLALGQIALAAGDLSEARTRHRQAREISDQLGTRHLGGFIVHGLGKVLLAAGDLDGAQRALEDAIAIRFELREQGNLAITRVTYAALLLERGELTAAETVAGETAAELERQGRLDDQAAAHAIVAQTLLTAGRPDAARDFLGRGTARAQSSENPQLRLHLAIVAARLGAAENDHGGALRRLAGVVVESRDRGLGNIELEARLARGETELAAGREADARAGLAALAAEADARGFHLIGRKAAAAAR